MKIAVVGSRSFCPDESVLTEYLSGADEIVSGGAKGVDESARNYAEKYGIKLTEFLPKYEIYGKGAPIIRNRMIVDYADTVVAFWDGKSRGTLSVIEYARKTEKECVIVLAEK